MNNENFTDIKGYEGIYKINKLGQVFSVTKNKILQPIIKQNSGYYFVNLYKNKRVKSHYIHKLMADTFLHSTNSLVVNHKDLNKLNNQLNNLELVTQKENIYHSKINGKQQRKKGSNNNRSKKVFQYDIKHNLIKIWECVMDIERELGIKSNYISNCALGKCRTSQGYIWKYEKE